MITEKYPLSPPPLSSIAAALQQALARNYTHSSVSVSPCPDLRSAPFHLAAEGLCGDEKAAEIGGQSNLFPQPDLSAVWSMPEIARDAMEMSSERGTLLGAGAGPYRDVGQNSEWAPAYSWRDGWENHVRNESRCALVRKDNGEVEVRKTDSLGCALMCNLFGSRGEAGDVLKITARKRVGEMGSFTECVQAALHEAYGDGTTVSLGGVVLIKKGLAKYHIMPDFPAAEDLPFENLEKLMKWLTWHEYKGPIVGLTVLHSADPGKKMGLRLEHTHTFSATGEAAGGHYHYDVEQEGEEEVEYEAYFNTAKVVYRIDRPEAEKVS